MRWRWALASTSTGTAASVSAASAREIQGRRRAGSRSVRGRYTIKDDRGGPGSAKSVVLLTQTGGGRGHTLCGDMESMSSGAHLRKYWTWSKPRPCGCDSSYPPVDGCGRPRLMYAPLASGCMTVGRTSRASAGGMPASSSTSSTLSSLHGGEGHSGGTGGGVCGVSWLLRA